MVWALPKKMNSYMFLFLLIYFGNLNMVLTQKSADFITLHSELQGHGQGRLICFQRLPNASTVGFSANLSVNFSSNIDLICSFGESLLLPHPTWKCQSPCRGIPSLCTYYCLQCEAALMSMQEEASLQLQAYLLIRGLNFHSLPGIVSADRALLLTQQQPSLWKTYARHRASPTLTLKKGGWCLLLSHQLFSSASCYKEGRIECTQFTQAICLF